MQVMRKNDLIRKNMVESVRNERNILAMANNPFVVRLPLAIQSLLPKNCVKSKLNLSCLMQQDTSQCQSLSPYATVSALQVMMA